MRPSTPPEPSRATSPGFAIGSFPSALVGVEPIRWQIVVRTATLEVAQDELRSITAASLPQGSLLVVLRNDEPLDRDVWLLRDSGMVALPYPRWRWDDAAEVWSASHTWPSAWEASPNASWMLEAAAHVLPTSALAGPVRACAESVPDFPSDATTPGDQARLANLVRNMGMFEEIASRLVRVWGGGVER